MEKDNIHSRLIYFLEYKNISINKAEKLMDYSAGGLRKALMNNKSIGSEKLINLLNAFPELSSEWLLRGTGSPVQNYHTELSSFEDVEFALKNIEKLPGINLSEVGTIRKYIRELSIKQDITDKDLIEVKDTLRALMNNLTKSKK